LDDSWQTAPPLTAIYSPRAAVGVKQWLLRRKLSRRSGRSFAGELVGALARRIIAAACCFISLLIIAWLAAFARAISAGGWNAFKTLNEGNLIAASHQAAGSQVDLLPVLITWAVLLIATPAGDGLAFRAAAILAGILGYLHFAPPPFLVTPWVSRFSGRLFSAEIHRNDLANVVVIWILLAMALLLQRAALGLCRGLADLRFRPVVRFPARTPPGRRVRHLCAALMIALALLLVVWAGTVIRLAAFQGVSTGDLGSYGSQGGLEQGRYLLVIALITALVLKSRNPRNALCAAVLLVAAVILVPRLLSISSALQVPLLTSQLAGVGREWGTDSLWAALFAYIPLIVCATHLVGRWFAPSARNLF
jgi:hypothetical protein